MFRLSVVTVLCVIGAAACGVLTTPAAVNDEAIQAARALESAVEEEQPTRVLPPRPDENVVEVEFSLVAYDEYFGAAVASVEERIYLADVIVRARLVSSVDNLLTFTAMEYLKGTGPTTFTVSADTAKRNTQWDGNEAILFLTTAATSAARSVSATFEFTDTTTFQFRDDGATGYAGPLTAGYTIDKANPVWLPSKSTSSGQRSTTDASYVAASTSVSGEAEPIILLAELKSKIEWITGGEGIEGYDECLRWSLNYIREHRDWEAYHGEPKAIGTSTRQLGSGQGSLAALGDAELHFYIDPKYVTTWITGDDAALFKPNIVDDDEDPSNGYRRNYTAARPLIAGFYEITTRAQNYRYASCNYTTEFNALHRQITVTAPAGTVHEAFFDPTATGFTSQGGELEPAAFTVGGNDHHSPKVRERRGGSQAESVQCAYRPAPSIHRAGRFDRAVPRGILCDGGRDGRYPDVVCGGGALGVGRPVDAPHHIGGTTLGGDNGSGLGDGGGWERRVHGERVGACVDEQLRHPRYDGQRQHGI